MANVTTRVPMTTVAWGDAVVRRNPVDAVATYYPGAMIALDASGLANKCDNTTGLRFDGINTELVRISVLTTGGGENTDWARQIPVERPFRFTAKIASAAAGDEGKALYALYDDEVSYSTSNSIFVGWVDQVLTSTSVLVRPAWSGYSVGGVVGFDGNSLVFNGATGVNNISMPDNLADALSFKEGSNSYLTFKTTDGSETILAKKLFDVLAGINFSGLTTANTVTIPDNLADALNVKEAGNSYLKFVTTNGSEAVVLGKAATGVSLTVTAGLLSSGPTGAGIGYAAGAGGAVSQATDRTTGVTLNTLTGAITTQATSLAAGAEVSFTVTNSTVAVGDVVVASIRSGPTAGVNTFVTVTVVAAGSFQLTLNNPHASTADTGAAIINFAIIKAVAA